MDTLKDIKSPINRQIEDFQTFFGKSVKSAVPLLNIITNYILKSKGKQLRPMFVMFSAALNGEINDKTYRAATLIELLHTATLVHDDVVDDSDKRRGLFSVNALWKNKAAVLVGDFLLSKGMLLALENKDFGMLQIVSDAIKKMSEGELLQIEKARHLNITEEVYFEIIRNKTASLFAACCACGAASVNVPDDVVSKMWSMGEAIGIAFQLKDDLFDYEENKAGKPKGLDIRDKKMTLPLIYLLNKASYVEKKAIINTVKNNNRRPEAVKTLMNKVSDAGGVNYAHEQMAHYKQLALNILSGFPDNPARQSLEKLINFSIERNN